MLLSRMRALQRNRYRSNYSSSAMRVWKLELVNSQCKILECTGTLTLDSLVEEAEICLPSL